MDICKEMLKKTKFEVRSAEPLLDEYFERVRQEGPNDDDDVLRRADIAIVDTTGVSPAILVDCTVVCPAGHGVTRFVHAGEAASKREKWKVKDYEKVFKIADVSRASVFFFGMESFGGMGGEARSFCKLIAKLSGELFLSEGVGENAVD